MITKIAPAWAAGHRRIFLRITLKIVDRLQAICSFRAYFGDAVESGTARNLYNLGVRGFDLALGLGVADFAIAAYAARAELEEWK